MTDCELKLLLKITPSLSQHYAVNPDSLLAKILGVFTVKCARMGNVNIMLMENTLRIKDHKCLKYIFDLKGSTVNRKVKGQTMKTTTLKDVNFLMAAKVNENFTDFGPHRKRLIKALQKDVKYLKSQGLMDYSMLLGIESAKVETVSELYVELKQSDA